MVILDKSYEMYYNFIKNRKDNIRMKKFIIILLVLLLTLCCFTGCKSTSPLETPEPEVVEDGIVVTVDPMEETAEAEEVIIEIVNK